MLGERERLGLRVTAVAFAQPHALKPWRERLGLDELPLVADPTRQLYEAFGLRRASFARVWLDPRVWTRYGQLLLRGRRPERVREDPLQLGGDVLLDREGVVRWIYRSRGPEDRPSLAAVGAALNQLRRSEVER